MMQISIVIVTYNASPWLFKCLNSLKASTVPLSVIIVDNHSTDDTLSIIANHFKEITLIQSGSNLGFGKANNAGIQHALNNHTDYIFLLNQDAWIRPDTIEKMVQISTDHPEFYVLSPMHADGTEKKLDLNFSRYSGPDYCGMLLSDLFFNRTNLKDVYETNFVNAALWLLPKDCLLKLGGFDPIFPHYGEDDDFINRVHYHGYKVGICPGASGVHSRSQQPFDMNKLDPGKRYNRVKVNLLISLKDINRNFFKEVMKGYAIIILGAVKAILQFNITNFLIYLKLFAYLTFTINKISLHRKISKKAGKAAVWLTGSA